MRERRKTPEPPPTGAEDYSRFTSIMAAAFDRLKAGERTYGPFSPATDRRDLRREAEEELLDAIVYAYLAILKLTVVTPRGTLSDHHREGYHLVLVPLPGDPLPEVRLRRGLKALLRTYGLRCRSVECLSTAENRQRNRQPDANSLGGNSDGNTDSGKESRREPGRFPGNRSVNSNDRASGRVFLPGSTTSAGYGE